MIYNGNAAGSCRAAAIFRPFGIRLDTSVSFNSPVMLGKLPTAIRWMSVARWWVKTADEIYRHVPDLAGL